MAGNQYVPDPRQELFAAYYTDPKSETFSNAYRSALRAGYEENYASNILSQNNEWILETIRDLKRLKKAEENLDMFLNYGDDPKIQWECSKFVASTMGRNKYHAKSETDVRVKEMPKPLLGGITNDSNNSNKETPQS
jgi:hypothetical protein